MKNIKILFLMCSVLVCQLAFAIRIDVENTGTDIIQVDPVWTGTSRGFRQALPNNSLRYDSGVHHLKGLLVKYADKKCYYYFFGDQGIRGTGRISLIVDLHSIDRISNANHERIIVSGHTDVLFQQKTQVGLVISGKLIQCDRVNNFK